MYACLWFVRAKLQKIIDICKNFAYFYKKKSYLCDNSSS